MSRKREMSRDTVAVFWVSDDGGLDWDLGREMERN